ncbi:MAG: Carbon storage regulator-like protein [Thermotoga sp. 50_1627]|uniref:carbon storage regulator CsrA n=1 Tax=Pseudothermotoga sp. TaxID=2033661 RepID=UPI00076D450E|nr:MAG: Carbon storage regulator-like protein [Thermotoga sp. 50_64]KUK24485.1 MAG: Carbon storage regulator-like protein [Thermotoga sp. 50_1627]MBC7115886.1 carbon storage regulator CsrA [Pseudothermotoga sp.]HBT39698.1 carbon storage regulator [Pseudothermotoga sp.]HCO97909.1 carbon storage regulator [Pseudothermotoga sp.]
MLVLTRKVGESFIIGDEIEVVVLKIEGSEVKIGISAPRHVKIYRTEIYKRIVEENLRASSVSVDSLKGVKVIDQDRRGIDQAP